MKRVLADLVAFGRQYIRSRVGTFFALAFPVILILLFGSIFSQSGTPQVPLYVQDLDGTPWSHAFVATLNNTTVIAYRPIPPDADFQQFIAANSVNVALQIPAGFETAVLRALAGDRNVSVNVSLAGDVTQSSYGIVASAVSSVATRFNLEIASANAVVGMRPVPLTIRQFNYIDLFLPGIIGFTALTTPLFGMTNICAEYRTRRYFKFLATTKLSKAEWLAAKILFFILLMFASVAIMLVVGTVAFNVKVVVTPVAVLLIIAGAIEFTSLGMVLGIFVRDPETGAAIANAIGFPMMFLAGTFFPIDSMPSFLQSVARGLPLTYLNEGLRATMVFGNEATALTYLAVTLAFAAVFSVIAARGLSWKSK